MRKKDFEYKVALSFAGEQRDYVEKVSKELTRLNVKHFYDYKEQVDLWGKNLIQYLDSVYFEKALYFVPFISAEYVEKVWTRLEVSSALDRNKNESRPNFQHYILPVRFDDTRVPGLVGSIAYIDARKSTPQELARMIYEKLNGNKKKAETDSEEDNTQFLPINYNNKINADKLKAMENVYLLQNKSHAMIVYGEKGLGKRSCTQCFIQKKKNVIKIYPNLENRFQLESVIHALKLDTNGVSSDSDLCFEEKIKKRIFCCL